MTPPRHSTSLPSADTMDRVKALRTQRLWRWCESGYHLKDALLHQETLYMPGERALTALDVRSGRVAWQWPEPMLRRARLVVAGEVVVAQPSPFELVVLDRHTGEARHRVQIPHLFRVIGHHLLDAQRALLLGERGTIAALDVSRGEVTWCHEGGTRGPAQFAQQGETVLTLQGNSLARLDATSGEVMWRQETHTCGRAVFLHLSRAVLLHAGAQRAQTVVRGLALESGRVMEEVSLDGYFLGSALSVGEDLWLSVERNRRPVIEVLRGETLLPAWLKPLQEQARSLAPSLTVLDEVGRARVLVQTGASHVLALDGERGETLWSAEQAPLLRSPLQSVTLSGVCVSAYAGGVVLRRVSDGEELGRFEELGEEPCLLRELEGSARVLIGESALDDGPCAVSCVEVQPRLMVAYDRWRDA